MRITYYIEPFWAASLSDNPNDYPLIHRLSGVYAVVVHEGATYYVPVEMDVCSDCDGNGYEGDVWDVEDDEARERCVWCLDGWRPRLQFGDALSEADYGALHRQWYWLGRRYGETVPRSIADYWLATSG